jgi:zinc protease
MTPAAFAALLAAACAARPAPQVPDATLVKKSDLLSVHRLANGLEVILVENHAVPLVTVEIAVRTGAFTETPRTDGLAHLYEHMFFKGNAAYPTQQAYDKREAELGISSNGTTSTEAVKYFITLPAANLEPGMEFMAHALLTMKIDPAELENEKKVVLNEYDRNESDPEFFLSQSVRQRLFHAYFYRKNPIGDRAAIRAATAELLQDFRRRYYVPNNSALIVAGDFDPAHALAFARHYFGDQKWPAGPDPHARPLPPHPLIRSSQSVIVNGKFPEALVLIGQYGPNVGADPQQTRDTFAADVLGTLVGLPQSKFQRALVDSGLCAQAAWTYSTQHDGGEIEVAAQCAPARVLEVLAALRAELEKFGDPGYFTEEELKAAQRKLEVDRLFSLEHGQQFAVELAFWWAVTGIDYYLEYLPQVKRVTLEDLRRFAGTWIRGRPSVTGVLVSEENQKALGLTPEKLGGAAETGARAGAVQARTLPNGLRLLLKPVKTNEVVSLQLFIDGGVHNIGAQDAGLEPLLLEAMLRGTRRTPKDRFQSKLAELGAQVGSAALYDYSILSLKCLKADFPECLDLVAQAVAEPLLDEAEITILRDQAVQALSARDADPQAKMVQTCNALAYAGHAYANPPEGTPASVRGITRRAVAEHYRKILVPSRMLLVVVGDVDASRIEAAFGALAAGAADALPAPRPLPSSAGIDLKIVDRPLPTAWMVAKFPAPGLSDPDYPALRLGLDILSDRLFTEVRSKAALSYAVAAGLGEAASNYGYLYCTSPKPNDAIKVIYEQVRRIQETPVDADELRSSALKLYTRHFMRGESNEGQAAAIGRGVLTAGAPDAVDRVVARIPSVTAAEVQAALRKYLTGWRFGIVGPESTIDATLFKNR